MQHKARKRFGQNFLHDAGVIRRVVGCIAPRPNQHLVEIGPGRGALTRELLATLGRLEAVELDRDLIGPLQASCAQLGELRVHSGDALRFDFCQLAQPGERLRLVGNLPYNISTPLLFHLLEQSYCIDDMHFMLQKEVVARMAAEPGGKDYGRLSVMPRFNIADPQVFAHLVNEAFSHRRKTLRNSLRDLLDSQQILALGIDPAERPERLALEAFVALANAACNSAAVPSLSSEQ